MEGLTHSLELRAFLPVTNGRIASDASGADFSFYSPCGMLAWSSSVDDAHYDDPANRTRHSIGT